MTYQEFLKSKMVIAPDGGIEIDPSEVNPALNPHQVDAVLWACKGGNRALFESFGLGKTAQELEFCRLMAKHAGGWSLIVLPLGVKQEFTRDAVQLLGWPEPPRYVRTMQEAKMAMQEEREERVLLTNYERVRDGDIDPAEFTATSLDEASVLRSFGSKTYQTFLGKFKRVPYKMVATATPSPNRYKELIHYAGYLGIMDSGQALAQPLTERILTPEGWKRMGDIAPGDFVIGRDGKPALVSGIYPQGEKEIVRVTFSDGSSTRCTMDHLWTTQTQYERNACAKFAARNPESSTSKYWSVKETREISQTLTCDSTKSKNHMIPMAEPVEFQHKDVLIDPYLLGLLIGDGCIRKTSLSFTTKDEYLANKIQEIVHPLGVSIRKIEHQRKDGQPNYDYAISGGQAGKAGRGKHSNTVLYAMQQYGLTGKRAWEKSLPKDYLFNSADVRLEILRGLMDTDGCVDRFGICRITTTSWQLAQDVKFITQSLGGTAYISEREGRTPSGGVGRKQYRITVKLPNGINPFKLPRKADRIKQRTKYPPKRYIVSVEPCGKEECQCIMVENEDHLYLTEDFIVTHNTRFFQRDSTKANNLTLYPHKEEEFWLWVSTWALFIQKPSDLGYDDTGYALPPMEVRYHRLTARQDLMSTDRNGQILLVHDAAISLKDAAAEKRDSIEQRVEKAKEIIDSDPDAHFIIWHDLEAERHAIKRAIPEAVEVYGTQDYDERERRVIDFSEGVTRILATKKEISGQGCNFQHHCHRAIFLGIDYEFNDFIQAIHRIYRFMQSEKVIIDIIYMDTEDEILDVLKEKWKRHDELQERMANILRTYGMNAREAEKRMQRSLGVNRLEVTGKNYKAVLNDCIEETAAMPDNSVDLIVTSIPFSNHYEYTPSYNDLGHNEDTDKFFQQMDYLAPSLLRVLKPGRIYACHTKDRVLFGNATGKGMPTIEPFHALTIQHYMKHGFQYIGMITVVTDVVRENNQTYRLGWSEQCKDGSKMGVGCPEYILLFRKLPTSVEKAYADVPVEKSKEDYTRAQWQIDAHAFWRSSGDRLLTKEELAATPTNKLQKVYRQYSRGTVYDYAEHVALAKKLDDENRLPATFMVVAPGSWTDEVWDDITRMRTLNSEQAKGRRQLHVCPLQIDIVERLINRYSNPGETVYDPFGGLMTVPVTAVKMGRYGIGCELNADYFRDGVGYLEQADHAGDTFTMFDLMEESEPEAAEPAPQDDREQADVFDLLEESE